MPRGLANEQPTAHQVAVPDQDAAAVRALCTCHAHNPEDLNTLLAALGLNQQTP